MSIADLGSLGEFVSSFAVLLTLIFLTLQMRQNTKAVRASTAAEMTSQWLTQANSAATSPALNESFSLVLESGSVMNKAGRHVFYFTAAMLKTTEFAHYQWSEGNLDGRLWNTHESAIEAVVTAPYFGELWAVQSGWYTGEFQTYINSFRQSAV